MHKVDKRARLAAERADAARAREAEVMCIKMPPRRMLSASLRWIYALIIHRRDGFGKVNLKKLRLKKPCETRSNACQMGAFWLRGGKARKEVLRLRKAAPGRGKRSRCARRNAPREKSGAAAMGAHRTG